MKVGILTFHFACNYGAGLQALALKRSVEQLDAEADVIDYLSQDLQIPSVRNGWGLWSLFVSLYPLSGRCWLCSSD